MWSPDKRWASGRQAWPILVWLPQVLCDGKKASREAPVVWCLNACCSRYHSNPCVTSLKQTHKGLFWSPKLRPKVSHDLQVAPLTASSASLPLIPTWHIQGNILLKLFSCFTGDDLLNSKNLIIRVPLILKGLLIHSSHTHPSKWIRALATVIEFLKKVYRRYVNMHTPWDSHRGIPLCSNYVSETYCDRFKRNDCRCGNINCIQEMLA
jgi:hypothetical protein